MSAEPPCSSGRNAFTTLVRSIFNRFDPLPVERSGVLFTLDVHGRKPGPHAEAFGATLHVHAGGIVFHVTCGAAPHTVIVTPRRGPGAPTTRDGPLVVDVYPDVASTVAAILDVCATDLTTIRLRPGEALRPAMGPFASMMATVSRLQEISEQP